MQPASRSVEGLNQSETVGPSPFLGLPKLGEQISLQDLIGDDLSNRDDGSIEMAALLRRDENTDVDSANIEAPASATSDHKPNTLAKPVSDGRSTQGHKTTSLLNGLRLAGGSLWDRLFKRGKTIPEPSKTVYSHKRRHILREILMVHLLPVAINFTLLGLYVGKVLWTPPWPTTNVSNALQFAAKFHEMLMTASLVSVILHHIRYRLLSSDGHGLPLGLLTSPFRILDVSYLLSKEFSGIFRSLKGFRSSEIVTFLIHVFIFVLAAVLGPASAVTMLPRIGEWQVTKTVTETPFYSTPDRNNSYHVYLGGGLSEIFPKSITANFNPEVCDYGRPLQPNTSITCSLSGLTDIVKGTLPPDNRGQDFKLDGPEQPDTIENYNITVQARSGTILPARNIRVEPDTVQISRFEPYYNTTYEATADVTTPTDAILYLTQALPGYYLQNWGQLRSTDTLDSFYFGAVSRDGLPAKFTSYPGLPRSRDSSSFWKQPHVSCFCSRREHDTASSEPVTFNFAQSSNTPYNVTVDAANLSEALNDRGMGFIDAADLNITPSYKPSTAFAFISHSLATLCLVKARWIDFILSGNFDQLLDDNYRVSMQNLNWSLQDVDTSYDLMLYNRSGWFNEADASDLIHLDLNWLDALDSGTGIDTKSKYSFFDGVSRVCSGSSALDVDDHTGKHPDITCMACGLGSGIAEGLSKVPYKSGIYAVLSTQDTSPSLWAPTLTWTTSNILMYQSWTLFGLPGNWTNSTLAPSQVMANSTRLDFVVTQNLHGYSFSSITIILAFVVLFLYVATVLIHISIITFGTTWSSRAWKSLGEFYVLALQSPTPTSVLDNTGGGVKVSRTWQARASVRELQDGNRVGIVVREPSQSDAEDESISKVRPDWKYS